MLHPGENRYYVWKQFGFWFARSSDGIWTNKGITFKKIDFFFERTGPNERAYSYGFFIFDYCLTVCYDPGCYKE